MVASDEPVDPGRSLRALWRSRFLITAIVVLATGTAFGVSRAGTERYRATTTIAVDEPVSALAGDVSVVRRLETIRTLLTTSSVLTSAARQLKGETARSLEDKVTTRLDPDANIIDISATDEGRQQAADIANTVATISLNEQRSRRLQQLDRTRAALLQQLASLSRSPADDAQVQAIRQELSALTVATATAGTELVVAEEATPPRSAHSPRPLRTAALVFAGSLFAAVLLALARDYLFSAPADEI